MANPQKRAPGQPKKRTQAERHAATRRKIIDATVTCIDSFGFPKTTMQKVAKAAGCTVGAVQHHFPSKAELLAAVLEDGFRTMSFELENVLFVGKTIDERVSLFVDHCWLHFKTPAFQANLHILMGMRIESPKALDEWMLGPLTDITIQGRNLWMKVFDDLTLTEEVQLEFLNFVFAAMSGIATFARITGPDSQDALIDSSLGALKKLLLAKFLQVNRKS